MNRVVLTSITTGLTLGVLLALVGLGIAPETPELALFGAYALVVLFVAASTVSSARAGAIVGALTIVGEVAVELAYFVSVYHVDISLVPYAAGLTLSLGRIPAYPLMGALGGYIGGEYFGRQSKIGQASRTSRTSKRKSPEKAVS